MKQGSVQYDYRDSRVLVTGGSQGIGLAIASAYREAGARVVVTGTRGSAADYEADLAGMQYQPLLLEEDAGIEALAGSLPALDILVNNAGASFPAGDEWTPEGFEASLRVNLSAAFRLASACRPLLAASDQPGGASIVGIASLTSFFGNPIVPGYGAAKAGLVQLTKTLGMSWAAEGIRVNAVAAGLIATRMTRPVTGNPSLGDPMLARTPLQRWGQPGEVAAAVLFLTSAGAAYITGTTLLADGGYSAVG